MAFFRDFMSGFLKKPIAEYPPNTVVEIKLEDYLNHIAEDRENHNLVLYSLKEISLYEIVLQKHVPNKSYQTGYSICRARTLDESRLFWNLLRDKVPDLCNTCPNQLTTDVLQEVFDYIQQNPKQSLAHICAHFGFTDCLKYTLTNHPETINAVDETTNRTPLHIAVKKNRLPTVQCVMSFNPQLDVVDKDGNNIFHHAARTGKEIISCICNGTNQSQPSENGIDAKKLLIKTLINALNNDGYSPLHIACLEDRPECVKELLRNGADINGASINDKTRYDVSSDGFSKNMIDQLETRDMKNGGTPLHWSKSPQCLEPLLEMGCDINAKNFQGETVLHVMVSKVKLPCIITLLAYGADVNAIGPNGNTPLHIAVKGGDVPVVQALVVFGAKVDCENTAGETPRHIAATSKKSQSTDMILYILHTVGAKRCKRSPSSQSPCNDGCATNACFNGVPSDDTPFNRIISICDSLLSLNIIKNAVSEKMNLVSSGRREDDARNIKLLCLDGGGIRGLILIQMLSIVEDIIGMKVTECYNWIAGTSTGGILAVALALGSSASDARRLYFRLKDKVFTGSRPYESEPLEKFLQKEFGEDTRMTDIKGLRLMITALVADRFPADVHFFRNYDSPDVVLHTLEGGDAPPSSGFLKPHEQLVWQAARSTGAAPTYFRSSGKFLDGGLISNNPTLDAMSEIIKFNAVYDHLSMPEEKLNLKLVTSLGTGAIPVTQVPIIDIFRPDSLYGVAKIAFMASSLGQLLVDQASQADGQVIERAKSWCRSINVPYFRMNPPISEDITLDETNNIKLINMLWETTAYMHIRKEELLDLKVLLQ